MTLKEYRSLKRSKANRKKRVRASGAGDGRHRMTLTERSYLHDVLGGLGQYEPWSLQITPDGVEKHVYTPDFATLLDDGTVVYHEVKGSYRLQSQDAARLRFCFAAMAYPRAVFVWAKLCPDGLWTVEVWRNGGTNVERENRVMAFRIKSDGGVVWRKR